MNKLSADDVLHESASLHERWPDMEVAEKRKIVEAIIEKVVIGKDEIDITYSHLPTSIEQCKNQQKLVALMGIAQRTVQVKKVLKLKKRNRFKSLVSNVKTVGNLIKIKRIAKNLTPGHVARKMGIAATVIYSWEDGIATPNEWEMELLAKIFGFDAKELAPYINPATPQYTSS